MDKERAFCDKLISQYKRKRAKLGKSQRERDDDVGVAEGLIAKWECGYRKPTLFNAFCWAESLNCDLVLKPRKKK